MSITENDLSKDQKIVFDAMLKWTKTENKLLTMGGVAGSGKTELISLLAKKLKQSIAFASFTGKAALNLKTRLDANKANYDYCGTIHGLIYIPVVDKNSLKVMGWRRRADIEADIIIIDEASMVSERIFRDLKSYGKKILAIGDFFQLPPIGSNFNLMDNPQLKLTEIHRQAAGNPIIRLSADIRNGKKLSEIAYIDDDRISSYSKYDDAIEQIVYSMYKDKAARLNSVMLSFFNKSRINYNNACRELIGMSSEDPEVDDVVICLKNNSSEDLPVFNGMRGMLKSIRSYDSVRYNATIDFIDEKITLTELINKYQFNQEKTFATPLDLAEFGHKVKTWEKMGLLFDYGYALTVHKSQGSGWENVMVFVERSGYCSDHDFARWLYTAVTRSSKNLVLVT